MLLRCTVTAYSGRCHEAENTERLNSIPLHPCFVRSLMFRCHSDTYRTPGNKVMVCNLL
jgi:hypothetical protein